MNLGLENRVAFIAGASSGLGRATARALLTEGCRIAICSRSAERIQSAARDLAREADVPEDRVLPLECDVTQEDMVTAAIDRTVDRFGGLNILITNAGGPPTGTVLDFSADDWREALELNLMSTINLTRAALPHLKEAAASDRPLARVLMVTSMSAKQPVAGLYLSNVSRAGVQGFAKSLSEEVGVDGITVNTILPGYTRTDRLTNLSEALAERRGVTEDDVEAGWSSLAALKRVGRPEEFAAAAVFLVSEPAAFITGVALPVDGGAIKGLL